MLKERRAAKERRKQNKEGEAVYSALLKITEAIQYAGNQNELFSAIHRIISGLMPAKNFFVAVYERGGRENETVKFPFFLDQNDPHPYGSYPLGNTLTGLVIRRGEALLLFRETIEKYMGTGVEGKGIGTVSQVWLGVPLKTRDRIIGAIVVQSYEREEEYGEREKQILTAVSGQIALAIELMRYREQLEDLVRLRTGELLEEKRIQSMLFEISQAVYDSGSLREFLMVVQSKITQLIDARNFYVALYDPEIDKYRFPYFSDEFDRADLHMPEDLHFTLTDYVRLNGPLLADHVTHQRLIDQGVVQGVVGTDSEVWLGVPLYVPGKNEAIGVMTVQSYEDSSRFGEKEKRILMSISTTVALAIDRISLVTELFHHFNNAVTGIRGHAEILLRSSEKELKWLELLQEYLDRYMQSPERNATRDEIGRVTKKLVQEKKQTDVRIGKIVEGIEEAALRMNRVFSPLLLTGHTAPERE